MELDIETIPQFEPLFDQQHPNYHSRYQVYYGGRGGRKSWETARGILIRALTEKKLVLCTREVQNSINDSVLRLLSDQIKLLGMSYHWDIQKTTIRGLNGSEFIFKGLNGMTIDSIKSLEGADICWVEEAHSVSDNSWQILIPTIRKQGSQIFATFNPDLPNDPVMTRFVKNTPPDCYLSKVSYLDNPDCPDTLIQEANYLREVDYDAYAHIWLGEPRQHSDAQIFKGKYRVESFNVDQSFGPPLDGADWGFATDPTVKIRTYLKDRKLYVRHEAYKVGCEIEDTPALFEKIPDSKKYNTRADNARPELISYMKRQGFQIEAADKWPGCVEDRVSFMKGLEQIIIHPDCTHAAEEFRLYSYKVDKRTGDILPEIVKKHDHVIDSIGYALTPLIKIQSSTDPEQVKGMFY
jgi:phage terminase large subunit